jgi:small subunit ribosomal protein S20
VANTKSACKRIEVAERNRLRNKAYKSTVKTLIDNVRQLLSLSYSKIDKAVQKGVIHVNNGNAKKSFLSKNFKVRETELKI